MISIHCLLPACDKGDLLVILIIIVDVNKKNNDLKMSRTQAYANLKPQQIEVMHDR